MARLGSGKAAGVIIVGSVVLVVAGSVALWGSLSNLNVVSDEAPVGLPIAGSGSFVVGSDVEPGIYRNEGAEESCRWSIIVGGSTLRNGSGAEPLDLALDRRLSLFRSTRCGTWVWVEELP